MGPHYTIANWDRYQHYKRKETMAWVKLYRDTLQSPDWIMGDADTRVLLLACLMVATQDPQRKGRFPSNPLYMQRAAYLPGTPNYEPLVKTGFLVPCKDTVKINLDFVYIESRTIPDPKEKEKEEGEEEIEGNTPYSLSGKNERPPYAEIVRYLNERVGSTFRATTDSTRRFIKARWNEGYRLDDFRAVIDDRCEAWLTDEQMVQYLRPSTLFNATKFEGYLNGATATVGGEWVPPEDR